MSRGDAKPQVRGGPRRYRVWLPTICCLVLVPAAFFAGDLWRTAITYTQHHQRQEAEIERFFSTRPGRYDRLIFQRESDGDVFLEGGVETRADHDALKAALLRLFGEEVARSMTQHVTVRSDRAKQSPRSDDLDDATE